MYINKAVRVIKDLWKKSGIIWRKSCIVKDGVRSLSVGWLGYIALLIFFNDLRCATICLGIIMILASIAFGFFMAVEIHRSGYLRE